MRSNGGEQESEGDIDRRKFVLCKHRLPSDVDLPPVACVAVDTVSTRSCASVRSSSHALSCGLQPTLVTSEWLEACVKEQMLRFPSESALFMPLLTAVFLIPRD